MFMIELHGTTTLDSWVLDTGCGTHIFTVLKRLKESRRLKHGELNLVMGNRKIMLVTRIGKYELMLKSRVRIDLNNCCYSSKMTRNIISFHALFKDGYKFSFDNENGGILVYSNGYFMFKASPCKGIYETVECISHNSNVILNVGSSNELDKSKLWHYRLGHVNKKRIAQLQKDGVLKSFDFKSDDVCRRGVFLKREMISKEDSGSKIYLKEIQESADKEHIVNTATQQEVVTPISDSTLSELDEPANYKEVMASLKAAKWWDLSRSSRRRQTWMGKYTLIKLGFENVKYPKRVCKLQKAIYGLKRASRSWNLYFHEKVTQFRFSRSEDESYIYVKVNRSVVVFLVLYVDDILLIGNDIPMLQSVKDWLGKYFVMKDLGDATYILGIKIYKDRSKCLIGLSQDTYLDKILKIFKIENSKKGNLPLHYGIKISKDLCPKTDEELDIMSRVPYALAVGSIMYAMTYTRPDVSFALSMVSRHQQNSGKGYGGEEELRVTGYCDASWQTYKDDSHSQAGWVFLLNGGDVTWKSLKQDTVADFTCESEYIAACDASKEAIWMKNFIGDLGVVPTVQDPIEIFCDNKSALALTKEPKDHGKSKHIERKYHFV
ncbi:retrotransposon protein, putative, ty1-copia subclass [Tanacetum coccineum]